MYETDGQFMVRHALLTVCFVEVVFLSGWLAVRILSRHGYRKGAYLAKLSWGLMIGFGLSSSMTGYFAFRNSYDAGCVTMAGIVFGGVLGVVTGVIGLIVRRGQLP
jgi:hypothetical protein